ncbi:MAG: nuclear transport factor 2 family protein [Candidatus Neomarinimicrobiota bacterium]|nr:nuclear transport factor 2 family protein [Bacteroidota bacterium]MEC8703853.1 nuclear transport factor 2 family protein [Candidatus Neomarinimicrobiota bacterium]
MSFLKQLIICSQFLVAVQANNNKILIKSDRKKVIEVVKRSYVNGAFNKLDTDAMKKGFHNEFAIFTPDGEEIKKYPIKKWINNTIKNKKSAKFDADKYKYDYEIDRVEVTGQAAAVTLLYSQDSKLVYTDYLLLSKFDSGWKIVAKVYHRHK